MPSPGPLASLRAPRSLVVAAAALVVALLLALGLASTAGTASTSTSFDTVGASAFDTGTTTSFDTATAASPETVLSAAPALADAAPNPADDGMGGHALGSLCLAITCLLLVLTALLPAVRRRGGLVGTLSRAVREAVLPLTAIVSARRPVTAPTRC